MICKLGSSTPCDTGVRVANGNFDIMALEVVMEKRQRCSDQSWEVFEHFRNRLFGYIDGLYR